MASQAILMPHSQMCQNYGTISQICTKHINLMRQLRVETGVGSKNLKFRTGIYYIIISVSRFPAVLHTIVLYGVIIIIHLPLEKPTREACAAVDRVFAFHA